MPKYLVLKETSKVKPGEVAIDSTIAWAIMIALKTAKPQPLSYWRPHFKEAHAHLCPIFEKVFDWEDR